MSDERLTEREATTDPVQATQTKLQSRRRNGVIFRFPRDAQNARRITGDDRVGWDVLCDHTAGANHCVFTDGDTAQNGRARTDRSAPFDPRPDALPILLGLQTAIPVGGLGIEIVDESDVMPHEHFVFQDDAFANEGVAGNLAPVADLRAFLDFHECADLHLVADLAAVQVRETVNPNVFAQLHVGGDLLNGLEGHCA